jgi:Undecaprenyl-phosphate galactose phosphotransferase WbaP
VEQRLTTTSTVLIPNAQKLLRAASTRRWRSTSKRQLITAIMVFTDVALFLLVWEVASLLQGIWGHGALSEVTAFVMVPIMFAWVGLRGLLGLYPGYGLDAVEQLRRHVYATSAALAILAIFALGFHLEDRLSRLLVGFVFVGLLVLAPFAQQFTKRGLKKVGVWGKPVVILGYKEAGADVADVLNSRWELGYDPVAIVEYRLCATPEAQRESLSNQHSVASVVQLARDHAVDTAIFAMPHSRREQLAELVNLASTSFRHVLIIPNLAGITNSAVVARDLAGTFAVEVKYNLLDPWALRAKRTVDLLATVIGGSLVLPLLLALALLVYLESGGPIFYRDRRMGRDGKLFSCVKFRTMVPNAEALLQRVLKNDSSMREEYTKYHKLRNDPRVTRVGRFLRKTSLDELPQLWNVLRGDMSLVGPRPYLPRESAEIGVTQSEILRVPPGITGPWQVSGRNHSFFSDRVQIDASYVRDWSIWLDIVLLARTAKSLLLDRAAY